MLETSPFASRWATCVALLLTLVLAVPGTAEAQEIRLPGLSGGALTEADLAQGSTIVVVWASWSPRCRDIDRRVGQLARQYGNRARVVAVNFQEDRQTASGFLAEHPVSVPVYLDQDGTFSKKYAITALPGLLVVQNGRTAYRGKLPDDPAEVLDEILQ